MVDKNDTKLQILELSMRLVQESGYNAFSYKNIAEKLGIRRAAIHYYFPKKEDLGLQLVIYYRGLCRQHIENVDLKFKRADEKLTQYIQVDYEMFHERRMCLCGMMTTEYFHLNESILSEIDSYFDEHLRWLTNVLEEGQKNKELMFNGEPHVVAKKVLASLEGALLLSRTQGFDRQFDAIAVSLLADIGIKSDT